MVSVDGEQMLVTNLDASANKLLDPSANTLTVVRGYNNTKAATHSNGASVLLNTAATHAAGAAVIAADDDSLSIIGASGNNSVTLTPSQVAVNGQAVNYSNIPYFQFNLGGGQDSLTVNGAALKANVPNAISSGTAVTVTDDGGVDLGGDATTVSSVKLVSGSIANGTLLSNTFDAVQGGTVSASTVTANLAGPADLVKDTAGTVVLWA